MANSADPDQLASGQLVWIYTVCKGRVYLGSAGQGLTRTQKTPVHREAFIVNPCPAE